MNKKKLVSLFMAVVMCFSILAQAALPVMAADTTSGTCGDTATWTLTDGVLTVSGTGAMTDYDSRDAAPWYSYRNEIVAVDISNGITHVGSYSFAGYPNITSLTMADGLETIGTEAFTAYTGETLTLPSTLQSAGSNAFATSNNLTDLYIPAAYTGDIAGVFGSCGSLQKFDVDASNTEYAAVDGNILSKDLTRLVLAPCARDIIEVPEGVTTIGEYALWGSHAVEVVIPDSVEEIEYGAFYVAQSLQSIEIPEGVTYLPGSCFGFDNSLETITLPASLTEVGSSAFEECTALSTVNFNGTKTQWGEISWDTGNEFAALCPSVICSDGIITNSDTEAATSGTWGTDGTWAFENGVLTVTGTGAMPDYTWSDYAEGDAYLTDAPWMDHYKSITSVVISAGITRVGDYSFAGYPNITSLSLPEGLLAIGQEAFMLYNGEELVLPSTLEILEDEAFKFAGGVSTVNIPASLTAIGVGALSSMSGVTAFTVDDANTAYKAEDGVVYTKDGTQLVVYPCWNQVTSITVPEGVEMIGPGAFWGNWKMTEVLLPSTLTSIAKWAFRVSGLVNLVIPDGVDHIDEYAFNNCDSLLTVAIPDSVGEIGNSAFARCTSLTTVYYDANQADWDDITIGSGNDYLTSATIQCNDGVYGESGDSGSEGESGGEESVIYMPVTCYHGTDYITINFVVGKAISDPENSSTLPTGSDITAWYTDPDLTQVWDVDNDIVTTDLSKLYASNYTPTSWSYDADTYTLTISGAGMVEQENGSAPWETYRTSIKHIVVEEGITGLGLFIFESHSGLLTVSLPDTLEYIGKEAFRNCGQLQAVEIPASVSEIGLYPFALCNNAVVTIDADNPYFEVKGGGIVTKDNGGWYEPELITILPATTGEYTVPAGVKTVESSAGTYHEGITKITVPETVYYIWDGAFSSMPNLEEAYVLAELENGWLRSSAFNNCWNLKKVVLSDSITRIGGGAFDGCHEDLVIYYMGTEAQWNAITFDSAIPDTAEVICNYEYTAPAEGTLSDTIDWSLVDGVLTLTGTGATPDFGYYDALPWADYIANIKEIVIGEGITAIGQYAFKNSSSVKKVTLPSTLTTIGKGAFHNCRVMETINLPDSLTFIDYGAFHTCIALTEAVIPAGVTALPDYAFYDCDNVKVTLHAGITEIGECAFWEYSENTQIEYLGTEAQWDAVAKGNMAVPDGLTVVFNPPKEGTLSDTIDWSLVDGTLTISGTGAMPDYDYESNLFTNAPWYGYKEDITAIVIGDGITHVGATAFADEYVNLASLSLPEGLESIGECAFSCYPGEELDLPSTLTTIGEDAFTYSENLTSLHIPANLTSGVGAAFGICRSLTEITVDAENTAYTAVDGVLYSEDGTTLELYPNGKGREFTVPEGVTTIGYKAFWGSTAKSITLPDTLTTLEGWAFRECINLTSIIIPHGVTAVSEMCFAYDAQLESIIIPSSVTSIGWRAFDSCDSLTQVYYGSGAYEWNRLMETRGEGNDVLDNVNVTYWVDPCNITVIQPENGEVVTSLGDRNWFISERPVEIHAIPDEGYTVKHIIYTVYGEDHYVDSDTATIQEFSDVVVTAEFEPYILGQGNITDDITWRVEDRVLYIEGIGDMEDYASADQQPWAEFRDRIKLVEVSDTVTHIGAYAFAGLENCTGVYVYEGLLSLGDYALADMALTNLWLPDTVESIGAGALSGYATSRFRLPGNMSVIVTGAFNGMSADIFNIHPHVTEIADGAFENAVIAVVVYDGIEEEWNNISIGENNDPLLNAELTFEGQSDIYGELETGHTWYIDLNNYELVVEGDGAMPDFEQGGAPWAAYVNSITRVAVKEGVTYIGEYAFADLPNLERVRLFDDVEVIGSYAFANSPIEYFHYANSVTEIRDYAFSGAGDVDMNNIYFAGNRDDYSNITVGEGNDTSLYPRHIDTPANADWITVIFDTGVHGITVDPIIMVDGYHFYPDEHMPVREGYVIHSWWNNSKWVGRPYDWENDCIWGDTTFYAKWTKLKTTDGDLPENSKVTAIRLVDWEGNKLTNVKVNYFGDEYYYLFDPIVDGEGSYNNLLTVTSSNTKVAEYDPYEGGYSYAIKIKSAGTAKITFASVQNPAVKVTATITVTRRANAVDLSLSKNTTTDGAQILLAGQSYKPTVTWTGGAAWTTDSFYLGSDDENVVQFVDGKFKAVGAGRTTIYINCFDEATGMNIFDYVEVEVFTEKVKAVQLSTSKMILDANLRLPVALAADVEAESKGIWAWPSNDGAYHEFDISWTASPNIVVYSENCEAITSPYTGNMVRVLALNSDKGSITVTFKAKDGSGKSAKATVQTGVAVQEIRTTLPNVIYGEYGPETTVAVGKSIKATASVYPADATVKTLKWSAWTDDSCQTSSDIVSVKSGTIKGLKAGKAFIRVDSTDGNDKGDGFWVNVVNPATKVVITGYTEHIHYQDNISRSSLTIKVLGADGTTDGVSQDVKITLGGAIGKYVVPEYSDGNGQWNFVALRAGKYTVKATTTDGTNKSATFTVNVEQHLFDFQPKAPKGVTAVDDSTWAVNVGTTFTPSAVYNLGEKAYAPAASAKKFTIALDPDAEAHTIYDIDVALEDAVTITGTKVKANARGIYKLVLTPVSATGCENCLDNTKEITLKVLYKNSTDLTNVAIRTNKGHIDGDTMYVRTGLKPQLTAMINGVKANTKKVEPWWQATDPVTGETLYGIIDAYTGKMDLTNVEPGTEINIKCIAYDNYDKNNSSDPVVMKVIVTEKLAKADIGLLVDIGGDTTVPASEAVLTIKEGAKTARVSVKDGATPSYTFKTSNAKILAVETVSGSEIMLVPTGVGTATITVTANDGSGVKNTFKVKVAAEEAPIKAIVPLAKTFTVYGGESIAIPFTLTSAKAGQSVSNPVVQWTTSDVLLTGLESESTDERGPAVMTEGDGRIILYTAEKAGKVTLTGTAMDGSKKTVKITVNIVDRSSNQALFAEDGFMLTLPANTANNGSTGIPVLTWGKSLTLKTSLYPAKAKNPNILWKVQGVDPVTYDLIDNPAGITIKNGKLTVAKSSAKVTPFEGAVLVTAYTAQQYDFGSEYEPIVQTQYIQVQAPVAKVALADTTGMFPGQTKQMEPVFTYDKYDLTPTAGDYPILWSVNDKKLATIDENGVLTISETAKVGKSVKVTAATQDGSGKKVTATIKIVKQP